MTVREVLDEYQERADSARYYTRMCGYCDAGLSMECTCPPASPRIPLADMIEYSDRMVAALRAVLDLHQPSTNKRFTCEQCEYFSPCPTQRAITEALGADA